MSEETPAKRGDAAWKEQRDAIARRNALLQRYGQTDSLSFRHYAKFLDFLSCGHHATSAILSVD